MSHFVPNRLPDEPDYDDDTASSTQSSKDNDLFNAQPFYHIKEEPFKTGSSWSAVLYLALFFGMVGLVFLVDLMMRG